VPSKHPDFGNIFDFRSRFADRDLAHSRNGRLKFVSALVGQGLWLSSPGVQVVRNANEYSTRRLPACSWISRSGWPGKA